MEEFSKELLHQPRPPPALRAIQTTDGFTLDGIIPWCTSAAKAKFIIAGASLNDGR